MTSKELVKRYVLFLLGLSFTALGISVVTKASLGTSPISAIPYALSLIIPQLSLGNWTIIFSLLLIVLQLILLRKDANKIELLLQIGVSFVFGYFIDFFTLCLKTFSPEAYGIKMVSLFLGCSIIAIGVYLQLTANVVMLPGDAFVCTLSKVLKKEYGGTRVCSDISMTVIAAILCLVFLKELSGVREGTIVAALIVGNIVKLITKKLDKLTCLLLPENKVEKQQAFEIPSQSMSN